MFYHLKTFQNTVLKSPAKTRSFSVRLTNSWNGWDNNTAIPEQGSFRCDLIGCDQD